MQGPPLAPDLERPEEAKVETVAREGLRSHGGDYPIPDRNLSAPDQSLVSDQAQPPDAMTASVTPSKGGTMLRKLVTFGAVTGATLVLAGSTAWGATPIRDAGDATATKTALTSTQAANASITVVRDAGDATAAKNKLRSGVNPYIPNPTDSWWKLFR